MSLRSRVSWFLVVGAACLALACARPRDPGEDVGSAPIDAGRGDPPDLGPQRPPGFYDDFPKAPVLDPSGPVALPGNVPDLFGSAGGGGPGGPCLVEPEVGSLFPRDWLRLRFRFTAPSPQNLFEIRLHADNQLNDLVVYTTATQWTMPAELWQRLSSHSADRPLSVSVRGAELRGGALASGPLLGTTGEITIAPVGAGGTIVYWTSSSGTVLRGFRIGDEKVYDVLRPAQAGAAVGCIGCHSSTPDGDFLAFSKSDDPGNGDSASIGFRSIDGKATEPAYLTAAAKALLSRPQQQVPTFSKAHYRPGDYIALSVLMHKGRYELAWTNLETPSETQGVGWGLLARSGDANMVASPQFSRSGGTVVYVSDAAARSGTIVSSGDLYTVPYNNRAGGPAAAVPGASSKAFNEFYPAFSPDDQLLSFSRLPSGQRSYNNPDSELFVQPAAGGTATRLAANDPPACSGATSPGVLNSWPKWAPEVQSYRGRQYYWISFSSTRAGANPQLYVSGLVVENGTLRTYRSLYLWNQPAGESNHTAAWDAFRFMPPG